MNDLNNLVDSWASFFDQATDPIQAISATGQFRYTNLAWRSLLGYGHVDLDQLDIWNVIALDSRDRLVSALAAVEAGANLAPLTLIFKTKLSQLIGLAGIIHRRALNSDGAVFWILWHHVVPHLQIGASSCCAAIAPSTYTYQPTSHQQRSQVDTLAAASIVSIDILDKIHDGLLVLDSEGRLTFVNTHAEHLLRRTRQELAGISVWQLFPSNCWQRFEHELYQAIAQQGPAHFEDYNCQTETWIKVTVYPDADGISILIQDITAHKQTEAALRIRDEQFHQMVANLQRHESELKTKEEFLSNVFNGVEEAIFVVDVASIASSDVEFRYVAINPTCERLMGYSSLSLQGNTPSDIFPTNVANRLLEQFRQCAATPMHLSYEECFPLNGQDTWWMTNLTPLCNEDGMVYRIIGTSIEITDRKQTEMLLQMQTERERLIFNSAQRIQQSLDLRQTLQTTVDEVRRFLQNDRVIIYRFNSDWSGDIAVESVLHPDWSMSTEIIEDHCFREKYAQAYRYGRVQVLDDIYDAQLSPCYLAQLERLQVRANLVVPIVRGDVLWGLLIAHECAAPRTWQQLDVDLLQQLADKLAIAVNQAELYEQAQTEIEERKRTEEALVESQTRFHNLVANVPGMIFRFVLRPDQSIRFAFLSSGCRELLNISPEEVEQDSNRLFDLVHPEDCPDLVASMQYSAQRSDPWCWEGRFLVASQPLKWLRGVARPSRQANGDLVWDGVMTDITREKQAEEWLRLLESAITNANDAILITEALPLHLPGPRIVYVNPAFTRNTGYQPHEVIGKTPRILQGPKTDAQQLHRVQKALQTWQPIRAELINYRKDQTEFWCDINIVPIADENGVYTHWMAIQRDITNRKHAEAEILKALGRERELNELRSQFISVTSHEFRTPLTTIQSSADLLRYFECDQQERDELFDQIQNSISHMIRLLEDVLFIGRAESGRLEFSPTSFDLHHFCQILVAEVETATHVRCPIEFHYRGDRPSVQMDEKLLRQILTNLLSNAVKYSPADGLVTLTINSNFQSVTFLIRDNGIGISPADQRRLFECFHRGRNVGTIPGTGLGLFIVKQCVELHHGTISVESAVNQGSTFIVTLPTSPTKGDSVCENYPRD
jgi:PAS domain S-box-containing protein